MTSAAGVVLSMRTFYPRRFSVSPVYRLCRGGAVCDYHRRIGG